MRRARRILRLGSALLLAATALVGVVATEAHAQGECDARKKECVFQRAMALFRCHKRAQDRGEPVDPNCLARADDKFGVDASSGCFADVEDTFPAGSPDECSNYDDTASIRTDVDGFVQDVIDAFGSPLQTECSKKPICVGKLVKGLLKCHMRADGTESPSRRRVSTAPRSSSTAAASPAKVACAASRTITSREARANAPPSATRCPWAR